MKAFIMSYPGDPKRTMIEMTRDEFFKIYPVSGRGTTITYGDGQSDFVPQGDVVLCDCCGDEQPGTGPFYLLEGSRLYCAKCYERYSPYCTPHQYGEVVAKTCRECGVIGLVNVRPEDWVEFNKPKAERRFVQDIFPYLTPGERDFLKLGMCEECFDKLVPET